MAHVYRNIITRGILREAGGLVEEITHHIQYVEGMGRYIGNGGAVDRNLGEVRSRLDRLKVTERSLSKFIKAIDSVISEEMAKDKSVKNS